MTVKSPGDSHTNKNEKSFDTQSLEDFPPLSRTDETLTKAWMKIYTVSGSTTDILMQCLWRGAWQTI